MHVRFDKVEVFRLRRESNLVIQTKKIYQIDYFELKRQNRRRTKDQFHRSDLYREWVLVQKRIIDDDDEDEDDKHSEAHTNSSIKEVFVGKGSSIPEYFDRLAIDKYRLAVDKIRKADQRRIRKQRRRRRRNQSNREPGRRGSCFSAVRKGSYSLL
jgi:hypothetical protein